MSMRDSIVAIGVPILVSVILTSITITLISFVSGHVGYIEHPQLLMWMSISTLFIGSSIYLALDEISGSHVPMQHWVPMLIIGGVILLGINRSYLFERDIILTILEYAMVSLGFFIWLVLFSLIAAANSVSLPFGGEVHWGPERD